LYFASLAVPALAAVFLVPITVHALGASRFGLLALAWAIAEGSGMFDLGLSRATVRFVADATIAGQHRVREVVLASMYSQGAMGCVGGILVFLLAPLLVHNVFKIPLTAQPEAISMFRVLSLHVPIIITANALRAALEGAQRFDISTALRIPGSLASVVIPALIAPAGGSLGMILWVLLGARIVLVAITAHAVKRVLLPQGWVLPSDLTTLREMLGYSGWVAVSAAVGPILANFDRFTVGSIIGSVALGYYSGAAEAANRFALIPVTAFSAMLPALAATHASEGRNRSLAVTRAARRQLCALFFPLCFGLFVFGPNLLGVWLGPEFARAAGTAFRILSAGIFLSGLAVLPLALLYGAGRPDLPAKINLLQTAVHIPLTIVLVRAFGLTGAAIPVAIRCAEDLIAYEWASRRAVGRYTGGTEDGGLARRFWLPVTILAATFVVALSVLPSAPGGAVVIAIGGLAVYSWLCWSRVLSHGERRAWLGMLLSAHRPT
jgi:O-antigen/teichoic acid export membrane protein